MHSLTTMLAMRTSQIPNSHLKNGTIGGNLINILTIIWAAKWYHTKTIACNMYSKMISHKWRQHILRPIVQIIPWLNLQKYI